MEDTNEIMEAGAEWDAAFDDEPAAETEDTAQHQSQESEQQPQNEGTKNSQDEQSEEEPASEPDSEPETKPQRYTLKTPEVTKDVDIDELIDLGRKGLDYDRVKQELTQLRQKRESIESEHEQFLQEMAQQDGVSVDDFIDSVRATALARRENIDRDRALERISYERQIRALEAKAQAGQKTQEQLQAEERTKQGFADFRKVYPDVKSEDIPNDVWSRVSGGMSLLDAYKIQEADRLRAEVEQLKAEKASAQQTAKNKTRSMGSKSTSGTSAHSDLWDKYLS